MVRNFGVKSISGGSSYSGKFSENNSFTSAINRKDAKGGNSLIRMFKSDIDDDSFQVKRKRKNKNG